MFAKFPQGSLHSPRACRACLEIAKLSEPDLTLRKLSKFPEVCWISLKFAKLCFPEFCWTSFKFDKFLLILLYFADALLLRSSLISFTDICRTYVSFDELFQRFFLNSLNFCEISLILLKSTELLWNSLNLPETRNFPEFRWTSLNITYPHWRLLNNQKFSEFVGYLLTFHKVLCIFLKLGTFSWSSINFPTVI